MLGHTVRTLLSADPCLHQVARISRQDEFELSRLRCPMGPLYNISIVSDKQTNLRYAMFPSCPMCGGSTIFPDFAQGYMCVNDMCFVDDFDWSNPFVDFVEDMCPNVPELDGKRFHHPVDALEIDEHGDHNHIICHCCFQYI